MKFLLISVFVLLASATMRDAQEKRRLIKGRPGLKMIAADRKLASSLFPGNDQWESGYVSYPAASTNFHTFYWMIKPRDGNANAPTVFWFTGGPGCSSDLALFAENGPWHFKNPADASTIDVNPYSWNSNATLIFVDQPVGTGFSYADADVYERNEDEVASDMFAFFQGFYKKYPELLSNKMFVTGESYGGHYVPAISNYIVSQNQAGGNTKLPFEGCAIGNGLVNPAVQYPQYANFSYLNGLISKFDLEKYAVELKPCLAAVKVGAYETAYSLCNAVSQGIMSASGIANPYNIHAGCPVPGLCYQFGAATAFLNEAAVQQAIGVNNIQWSSCNMQVNQMFSRDWMHDMSTRLLNVIEANHTVLVYSGKLDYICNYRGGQAWTRDLAWSGQVEFNNAPVVPWTVDGKTAGTQKIYENFAFVAVDEAGHMVPMDQPVNALNLLNRFISGGWRQ